MNTPVTISLCTFNDYSSAAEPSRHLMKTIDDAVEERLPTMTFPVVYGGGVGLVIARSHVTEKAILENKLKRVSF